MAIARILLQTQFPQQTVAATLGIGLTKNVLSAQLTGFSTPTDFVSQFLISAELVILLENVLLATLAMILLLITLASSHLPTLLFQLISDVRSGTGPIKLVPNAQPIGTSQMENAPQSQLLVSLLILPMELVPDASKDTTSSMELAFTHPQIPQLPPISVAKLGMDRPVLPALTSGSLVPTKLAPPSPHLAKLMTQMETASLAMQDMI